MKKIIGLTMILILVLSSASVAMAATVTRGPHNYSFSIKNYTYSTNELSNEYYEGYDWTNITDKNSAMGFD